MRPRGLPRGLWEWIPAVILTAIVVGAIIINPLGSDDNGAPVPTPEPVTILRPQLPIDVRPLTVMPDVIHPGELVTLKNGICSTAAGPIVLLLDFILSSDPPQKATGQFLVEDAPLPLAPGQCSPDSLARPLPAGIQPGRYTLTIQITGQGLTGVEPETIISNGFDVLE